MRIIILLFDQVSHDYTFLSCSSWKEYDEYMQILKSDRDNSCSWFTAFFKESIDYDFFRSLLEKGLNSKEE